MGYLYKKGQLNSKITSLTEKAISIKQEFKKEAKGDERRMA